MNEIVVELEKDKYTISKAICDITKDLDCMSKLDAFEGYDLYHHYIYFSRGDIEEHLLAIRVPGGTVGSIEFDDNFIIKSIGVDTKYVIKSYPTDVNEEIKKKYIGSKLIFPKEVIEKYEFKEIFKEIES